MMSIYTFLLWLTQSSTPYNPQWCSYNKNSVLKEYSNHSSRMTGYDGYYFDLNQGRCRNNNGEVGFNYKYLGECGIYIDENFSDPIHLGSLRTSNLNGVDLRYSNFRDLNAVRSKLTGSRLECINAVGAVFSLSTFNESNISGGIFQQSHLDNVIATNLVATGTDFSGATLSGSNFSNGVFSYSNMGNSVAVNTDFMNAKLNDINAIHANLINSNFSGADLSHANLSHANFLGSNFSNAQLGYSNLTGANFRGANLLDADLGQADIRGTDLSAGDLKPANLKGAIFDEFTTFNSENCGRFFIKSADPWGDSSGIDQWQDQNRNPDQYCGLPHRSPRFMGIAELEKIGLTFKSANSNYYGYRYTPYDHGSVFKSHYNCTLKHHGYLNYTGLNGRYLTNKTAECSDWSRMDLSGRDLSYVNFNGAMLAETNFTDANLEGATFKDSYISGANFTRANLTRAYMDLQIATPPKVTYFQDAITTDACLCMDQVGKYVGLDRPLARRQYERNPNCPICQDKAPFDFSERILSDEEFIAFFSGDGVFSKITKLTLSKAKFNHDLLSQLPVSLTYLKLRSCDLNAEDVQKLTHLTNLTFLDLAGNRIKPEGAARIATMTGITSLDLSGNQIGDVGAASISMMPSIISLRLGGNKIGDAGAAHIATMTGITSLDLGSNYIGDAGSNHIAHMRGITSLDLNHNRIGDAGAAHIATMTGITSLDVRWNNITAAAQVMLRERLPNTRSPFWL